MKVGILGSGEVAKTLASGFLKHGHDVTLGSRTPEKLDEWAAANPSGKTERFVDLPIDRYVTIVEGQNQWK